MVEEKEKTLFEQTREKELGKVSSEEDKKRIELYYKVKEKTFSIKPLTAMEIIAKIDKGDRDFSNVRIVGLDCWKKGCNW